MNNNNSVSVAADDVLFVSTGSDHVDAVEDIVTITAEIDGNIIVGQGVVVPPLENDSQDSDTRLKRINENRESEERLVAAAGSLSPARSSPAAGDESSIFIGPAGRITPVYRRQSDTYLMDELTTRLTATVETEESTPQETTPEYISEDCISLPPEPDTPAIKSVRDQLAETDGVERTQILSSLYGPAVTSPPPDTTYKIAIHTEKGTAYIIYFSEANGWENVEQVPPGDIWKQHTLTTVNADQ